ncbi:endocuticle structural protein SgAbd-6-like [Hyposmocoma kahamanoa]|uniref:endocuticle structural protein SgAbd-6-like n=1 Tax=Hyposmocoma kahamanoa TaxID=1477025 RepID=UPI000E6D93F6|nr:endocuticle structural protein SgAbd-6-like [Hyposmocoma kahamanoa]
MYTTILLIFVAIVLATSAPVNDNAQARILVYDFTNDGSGNYKFSYETSNGLTREETGEVVNVGTDDEHIVVRGVYSYVDADGNVQNVSYTADENGYQQSTSGEEMSIPDYLPPSVVASLLGG